MLAWILPFSVLARTLFPYFPRFYLSPVLARILYFFDIHPNSTLLKYSHGFYLSGTRSNPFSGLARILPFSGTRLDSTFSGTRPDSTFSGTSLESTLFRYSLRVYPFSILSRTLFRYSPEFYPSPVLDRILPFFETFPDSTFPGTLLIEPFQYSPRFYPSPVFARILNSFGASLDSTFPSTRRDLFFGTCLDSTLFRYSLGLYPSPVLAWFLPFPVLTRTLFR